MKKKWRNLLITGGLCFSFLGAGAGRCLAQEQGETVRSDASHVILVTETNGAEVTVTYYQKEESRSGPGETSVTWNQIFTVPGLCGRGGITEEKREGDGKTAAGIFGISMAFGIQADPGSMLPYHQLQDSDYWVDDPDSIYYNQLVNIQETGQAWTSAEHMAAVSPEYNYGLALDYNKDCVPGAGSAIFIHCEKPEKDAGSQGCIRIPEEQMKLLIQSVDETCQVLIGREFTGV